MLLVLAFGLVVDMVLSRSMSVAAVADRVESCMARWALLWILSFFGTLVPMFTGRPALFLGLFAVLKALWEGGGLIGRIFGSKPAHGISA
jgi:hypothetical protein